MNSIHFPQVVFSFALGVAALALVACENPARDKPHATVSEPVAAASPAPSAGVLVYAITPQNSKIQWTGSKVTGSHDGAFTSFSGSIVFSGAVETSRVAIDIDTTSLTTDPDKLQAHLKSADFFDVQRFPKASFASTSILPATGGQTTVTGNLELHGTVKSIAFPATITPHGDAIDAKATFSINRKDFGLTYPGKADDLIRDEVVLKLTIHAEPAKS